MRFGLWRRRYAGTLRRLGRGDVAAAGLPAGGRRTRPAASVEAFEPRRMLSASSPLSFVPGPTYLDISTLNAQIVTADFRNDGRTDFVTTRGADNIVNVMLNNGDGTFSRVPIRGGGVVDPRSVAVGDFNGDGIPDVAISTFPNGNGTGTNQQDFVKIAFGQGDGTFATPVLAGKARSGFGALAVADFNGDGLPDIAVTSIQSVSVLFNQGGGVFSKATRFLAGPGTATALTAADLNGDGVPDLVATQQNKVDISVLIGLTDGSGRPTGSFAHFALYHAGGQPRAVTVGDLNGDVKPDILSANGAFRSGISAFLNQGDGTFSRQVRTRTTGNFPQAVAVADFNGDGIPDAAVTDFFGPLRVLPGNADGSFGAPVTLFRGSNGDSLAVGDVNGDGKPDIIVSHSGNVTVLLNTGG